jgi:hypothetical protein
VRTSPRWLVVVAALAVGLPAASAPAQDWERPATRDLQTEITRRRLIVPPRPDPAGAAAEIDATVTGTDAQQRVDRLLRDTLRPFPRRPDLDPAVSRGIQAETLRRALGR